MKQVKWCVVLTSVVPKQDGSFFGIKNFVVKLRLHESLGIEIDAHCKQIRCLKFTIAANVGKVGKDKT